MLQRFREANENATEVERLRAEVARLTFLLRYAGRGTCVMCDGCPPERCACYDRIEALFAAEEGRADGQA